MALFRLLLLLFTFSFNSLIHSQVYPNSRVDSLLRAGINQIINQDYSGAEVFINSLQKEFPQLPLGKIYLAAIKISLAYDYAEEFDDLFIIQQLEDAKEQAEDLIDSDEENIWYRYFYALAEGYIAYFDAINGSWLSRLEISLLTIVRPSNKSAPAGLSPTELSLTRIVQM